MAGKVLNRHRASGGRQAGGDVPGQTAPVEIVQPLPAQPFQGLGESRVLEGGAGFRGLSVHQVGFGEPGHALHLGKLFVGVVVLRAGHGESLAGVEFGVFQQPRQGQPAAPLPADFQRFLPAGYRAGHGQRR